MGNASSKVAARQGRGHGICKHGRSRLPHHHQHEARSTVKGSSKGGPVQGHGTTDGAPIQAEAGKAISCLACVGQALCTDRRLYVTLNTPNIFDVAGDFHYHSTISTPNGQAILLANIAESAFYNSDTGPEVPPPPRCDPGSRLEVVKEIMDWVTDDNKTSGILCMKGTAGIGKSAIQGTIAEKLDEQKQLGAGFFFSSRDMERNNKSRFIATIAYQLAQYNEEMAPVLYAAVERDATIFRRSLKTQAEVLIVQPLLHAPLPPSASIPFYTIIVDGLDECKDQKAQVEIIHVMRYLLSQNLPIKFILASRPEHALRVAIEDKTLLGDPAVTYHIDLKNHNATTDIRNYLYRNLRAIGEGSKDRRIKRLGGAWPSEEDIDQLKENASGHFIYAATVVKFLDDHHRSPFDRLNDVLSWVPGVEQREEPFAALDILYMNILQAACANYKLDPGDPRGVVRMYQKIRFAVIRSCSIEAFETLLGLEPGSIDHALCDMHSVVDAGPASEPTATLDEIKAHHKSFDDFLDDEKRSKGLYVSEEEVHAELVVGYLGMIRDATQEEIQQALSEGLSIGFAYALRISLSCWLTGLNRSIDLSKSSKSPPTPPSPSLRFSYLPSPTSLPSSPTSTSFSSCPPSLFSSVSTSTSYTTSPTLVSTSPTSFRSKHQWSPNQKHTDQPHASPFPSPPIAVLDALAHFSASGSWNKLLHTIREVDPNQLNLAGTLLKTCLVLSHPPSWIGSIRDIVEKSECLYSEETYPHGSKIRGIHGEWRERMEELKAFAESVKEIVCRWSDGEEWDRDGEEEAA